MGLLQAMAQRPIGAQSFTPWSMMASTSRGIRPSHKPPSSANKVMQFTHFASVSVKEEPDYAVPAQVTRVRKVRTYSPSPPRTARYSSTRIIEERRPSGVFLPPPAPSEPVPVFVDPLPSPLAPPPAPTFEHSSSRIETQSRRTSRPPSTSVSASNVETKSKNTSRVPSVSTRTRSHFVEVEHEDSSSSSSSSSSSDDLRSRTTHKTSTTHRSSKSKATSPLSEYSAPSKAKNTVPVSEHSMRSKAKSEAPASEHSVRSKARSAAPISEYSMHEKEYRRERAYSRPSDQWETYRYVDAPPDTRRSISRRDGNGDPRMSRESYWRERERERLVVEDDDRSRRREYMR